MNKFDELMQEFVNEDYSDLVAIAQRAMVNLLPICKEMDKDNNGAFLLTSIILSAIASDGKLTQNEYRMLKDALNLSDEAIAKFISMYDSRMADLVDRFADALSTDVKTNVLTLITAVAACDETISREETAFIRKILA